jgi:CRP-like cAMP-binding protein
MLAKETLRMFPLFSDLDEDELAQVAAVAEKQHCPAGKRLFAEGEVNGTLYGVVKGSLQINKMVQCDVEQTLCRLREGEFFGEVGFINGGTHCASADAVEETVVFKIERGDFDSLVEKDPVLGYKVTIRLAGQLGRFLRDMDEQYLNLSSYVWGRGKR